MKVWKIIVLLMLVAGVLACQQGGQQPTTPVKDGLFVHLSHGSDNPHRLLMGLMLATKMADSVDVIVFADIEAVHAFLKGAEDLTMAPFESSQTAIAGLLAKGVTIMVCPGCLEAAGKTPGDLMDGVQVAQADKFFGFTEGRILSLDY